MGVELALWAEVISKYPVRYTYQGVRGSGRNVVDAIVDDDRLGDQYYDKYLDSHVKSMKEDPEYVGYPDDKLYDIANDSFDPDTFRDHIEYSPDIIAKHPPVGVIDPASDNEVDLNSITHFCVGCGNAPVYYEDDDVYNYKYCGLCGCDCMFDKFDDMVDDFGIKVYPFIADIAKFMEKRIALSNISDHYKGYKKRYLKSEWTKDDSGYYIHNDNRFIGYRIKGSIICFRQNLG